MPDAGGATYKYWVTWADLDRWERKAFHRENESRIRRGLTALSKNTCSSWKWHYGGH